MKTAHAAGALAATMARDATRKATRRSYAVAVTTPGEAASAAQAEALDERAATAVEFKTLHSSLMLSTQLAVAVL
eukprot:IDg873t1